jgi:ABC-type phosphate/phosphonate transport system substrate-binding protein
MTTQRILLMLLLAGIAATARAADRKPLELGVIPYLPTEKLIAAYQPLRNHLEEKLRRKVVLSTAPDFTKFLERSLRREYDLIVIGSGLGRQAELEAGYNPLVATRRNIKALIVVRHESPYAGPKDLAGKRVATIDPMTGLTQLGQDIFRRAGMLSGRDYVLVTVKSPSNAIHTLLHDDAEAAVTSALQYPQVEENIRSRLRVIAESREIPGLLFMLRPGSVIGANSLRDTLLAFARSDAGKQFIDELAIDGLRVPTSKELKALDDILPELRKR